MDGLSVAASIIAVVQLTTTCLKLGKKYFGPSVYGSASLQAISTTLYGFNGTIRNLQTHFEINEEDQARLDALSHLDAPLKRCKEALEMLEDRLKSVNLIGQYVAGKFFDRKLRKCLQTIDDARTLFALALDADQK